MQLSAFEHAGFTLERDPDPERTDVTLDLDMSASRPLQILLGVTSGDDTLIQLGALPANLEGTLTLAQAPAGFSLDIAYGADAGTPVLVQRRSGGDLLIAETPMLPAEAVLDLDIGRDENGETSVSVNRFAAISPMAIRFEHSHLLAGDPHQGNLRVSIDSLPQVFSGTLTHITCGFAFDLDSSHGVGRIEFDYTTVQPAGTSSAPSYVSEGCPTSTASESGTGGTSWSTVEATIEGIPADRIIAAAHVGVAGRLRFDAAEPIGRIDVDVRKGSGEVMTFVAENVYLREAAWDMDGHSNYGGVPKSVFLDMDAHSVGRTRFNVVGDDGREIVIDSMGPWRADDLFVEWSGIPRVKGCFDAEFESGIYVQLPGAVVTATARVLVNVAEMVARC